MAKIPYVTLWHTTQMRLIKIFVLPHTVVENLALSIYIIYLVLVYGIMQENSRKKEFLQ